MEIIPAQKKKVVIDFDEYEKLWDFVYSVACKDTTAPCGSIVGRAKYLNRFKMTKDKASRIKNN